MPRKNPTATNPFLGRWHIVSMKMWDESYFNAEVQAFINWRASTRDGEPAVEWSWEGGDGADGTPMTGRGWAKLQDVDLHGKFFIHLGDESGFLATSAGARKRARKR